MGSSASRGSVRWATTTSWRAAEGAQLAGPSRCGRGGRTRRRRARAGVRSAAPCAARRRAMPRRCRRVGACGDGAEREHRVAAGRGRQHLGACRIERHRAEPVARARDGGTRTRPRPRARGRASRGGRCRSRGWPCRRRRTTSRARGRRSCCARGVAGAGGEVPVDAAHVVTRAGRSGRRRPRCRRPATRPWWSPWSRPSSLRATAQLELAQGSARSSAAAALGVAVVRHDATARDGVVLGGRDPRRQDRAHDALDDRLGRRRRRRSPRR